VKVGTRLTAALLLCVIPILAVYSYWSVQRSTRIYVDELRRNARAITHGLAHSLNYDIAGSEWDQIADVFRRMSAEGTRSAVFDNRGKLWFALPDFPRSLVSAAQDRIGRSQSRAEFEMAGTHRRWFCHLVPLDSKTKDSGYLLVAQDWTGIREDVRTRAIGSIIAALAVMGAIALMIPLVVRRYVTRPLADMSAKVMRFSNDEESDRGRLGDEVTLITEEFRKLDEQLTKARADLVDRHRRQLELERRLQHADRLATIGTLASGLAHEIGTPMGVIRGRAEYLLRKKPEPDKTVEGLETIIGQIDRIYGIVRTLLDYARPRESARVTCDIRPIVEHALSLVETEAERRNVRLTTELGNRPLDVECDAGQLEQVFVNLAMNALDAMAATGGTLRVFAESEGNGKSTKLKLTFEDTGPGIPEKHRARIFAPFFSTKEPGKGTGMGLAVSESIMHDHHGELDFRSSAAGTRFFVTMPFARARLGQEIMLRQS
jgi:two-component system, NtrC family, sensor kinase